MTIKAQQAKNLSWPLDTIAWDGKTISTRPLEEILQRLAVMKDAGLRQVMLAGYSEAEPARFSLLEGARNLRALLEREGFSGCQHHGICPLFAPGSHASQNGVRRQLRRSLEITAAMGVPVLVLHAGRPAGHHSTAESLLNAYRQERERTSELQILRLCAENLQAAMPLAHSLGVAIALENVDRFEPLSSLRLLPRLVNAVNDSHLGYCFDSGHAYAGGTAPEEWLRVMGRKLLATHLHDNHGPAPRQKKKTPDFLPSAGIDEHLPPGFGTIDWRAVIRTLRSVSYCGVLNFESPPWNLPGADGYLAAIRYWRQCEKLA